MCVGDGHQIVGGASALADSGYLSLPLPDAQLAVRRGLGCCLSWLLPFVAAAFRGCCLSWLGTVYLEHKASLSAAQAGFLSKLHLALLCSCRQRTPTKTAT